jgi:EamA domain-containing membrane protein RarD
MLVGEPVVAVLLGVVVLGEHLVVRGVAAVILAVAVAAMTAATIALGRDSGASTTQSADTATSRPAVQAAS